MSSKDGRPASVNELLTDFKLNVSKKEKYGKNEKKLTAKAFARSKRIVFSHAKKKQFL